MRRLAVQMLDDAVQAWGTHDQDDPFPVLAALRERGAVHRVRLADGHEAWVVARYAEAKAALADPRLSKDMGAALAGGDDIVAEGLPGPAFARHMLNVDPPDHTRLRRLVAGAFTQARVEALRPAMQATVDELLDAVAAAGPEAVDLVEAFAFPLPFTVICELLGVPSEDRARLGRHLTILLGPTATPDAYARAKASSDVVTELLAELVAGKRRHPGDDLVSGLVAARDGDDVLDEREMLSTIFQLIVAGHETTTNLIGNGVVALLHDPAQLATLLQEPDRWPAAVEELIRFDGPAQHATFRYATEDVVLGDTTIPAGGQVLVCLAAANRDAAQIDGPDRLDVTRVGTRHLGFGHGIHHCLGAGLARMEGQMALASLFARFPHLRLAVPASDLRWGRGDGVVLRGLTELPVLVHPPA
jgi:cytochrome P450